jgi:anaerobic magnesium-protoporphyrin IX monomethyl ester cyclase
MALQLKKIAFVCPYPYYARGINEATLYPPIGLASIAAYLEKNGAECIIIDANVTEEKPEEIFARLKAFNPDVVGIQMNVVTAKAGVELAKICRDDPSIKAKVVLGGPFATSKYEKLMGDTGAFAIVRGEGEQTFLEFCQAKDYHTIEGLAFKDKDGKVVITKERELFPDINQFPYPAYHLLPDLRKYRSRSRKKPFAPIFTSRGCPFRCTFCNANIFGKTFRARSPENVIREIDMLVKKYGVKQIDIIDDNFSEDVPRAEKIIDLIISRDYNLAINFQNGLRADRLTKKLVHKMKLAGVYKTGIGIESANAGIRNKIKKGLNIKCVEQAIQWCREEGIISIGFFMLGFPDDTEETLQETIDYAIRVNPSLANFSLVVPLPGTELYDQVKANNWFTKSIEDGSSTGYYSDNFYYTTPNLKQETVLEYQKKAYRTFNFRPSKILDLLSDIKSVNELKWTIHTSLPLIKRIITPKAKS